MPAIQGRSVVGVGRRDSSANVLLMTDRGLLALDLRHGRSAQPKHERLRLHLIKAILAGDLRAGDPLPSENTFVEQLGVARNTVRQAITSLQEEGLVRRVQGKGTFVESNVRSKLKHGQDIFALVVLETREGFYPSLLHGFESAAVDIHYQTLVCSTGNDVGRQADIFLQLLDKEVGGIAINPTSQPLTPAHQIRQLQKQGVPVILLHRSVEGVSAPLLSIPFREVGRVAGQALAERGHRRVVLLDSLWTPIAPVLLEGFNAGLRTGGCERPGEHVFTTASAALHEEEVLAALRRTFARPDRPTAAFATTDSLAEMVYVLLPQLGVRVPDDVSLVGFGGAWRDGALMQRLTSVVVDEVGTGRQAVSLLHEMRRGDRPIDDNEVFVMELGLSGGQTLAPPPATTADKIG
jgi:GntR family transcriptional regulator, arabinose operon transcriptional repressor